MIPKILLHFPLVSTLASSRARRPEEGRCTHRGRSARLASWPHWRWRSAPPAASAARSTRSRPRARSSAPSRRRPTLPPSPAAAPRSSPGPSAAPPASRSLPASERSPGRASPSRPRPRRPTSSPPRTPGGTSTASVTVTVAGGRHAGRPHLLPEPGHLHGGPGHHAERPVEHRGRHHLLRGEPLPPGRPRPERHDRRDLRDAHGGGGHRGLHGDGVERIRQHHRVARHRRWSSRACRPSSPSRLRPAAIAVGGSSVLSWDVLGATLLSIDNGVGTGRGHEHHRHPDRRPPPTASRRPTRRGPSPPTRRCTWWRLPPTCATPRTRRPTRSAAPSPRTVPAWDGGTPTSYVGDLPSGLVLDPTTGIISGTPTAAAPATPYTITASNMAGSTTVILEHHDRGRCPPPDEPGLSPRIRPSTRRVRTDRRRTSPPTAVASSRSTP